MYSKVVAIGNLGRDAELRYTPQGTPVCSFTIAVNERWKGKDGVVNEKTNWLDVTTWGGLAEVCGGLEKGRQVLVEGVFDKFEAYTGRDGNPRPKVTINATVVKFMGGHAQKLGEDVEQPANRPFPATATPSRIPVPSLESDEDIPF